MIFMYIEMNYIKNITVINTLAYGTYFWGCHPQTFASLIHVTKRKKLTSTTLTSTVHQKQQRS